MNARLIGEHSRPITALLQEPQCRLYRLQVEARRVDLVAIQDEEVIETMIIATHRCNKAIARRGETDRANGSRGRKSVQREQVSISAAFAPALDCKLGPIPRVVL